MSEGGRSSSLGGALWPRSFGARPTAGNSARAQELSAQSDDLGEQGDEAGKALPAAEALFPPVTPMSLADQKLKAEIDEIEARLKLPGPIAKGFGATAKYLAILVPLGIAAIGVGIQWNQHQEQREQLARFDVGDEVMKLAADLPSLTESKSSLAASQLAWFGRPATFLLFEHLAVEPRPVIREAIVMALAEIARNDTGTPTIVDLLSNSTLTATRVVLDQKEPSANRIEQRLIALADALAALRASGKGPSSENLQLISTLRQSIETSTRSSDEDKSELVDIMDQRFPTVAAEKVGS